MNRNIKSSIDHFILKNLIPVICAVIMLPGLSGCATMHKRNISETRLNEDIFMLREDVTRVQGRMENVDMEYHAMFREIEQLRENAARAGNQTSVIMKRLDQLERNMADMNAARVKDREVIIEQLSARITQVLEKSAASSSRPRSVGREHTVQTGETLSQIAAAYKVSSKAIIDANDIQNPNLLKQGQTLFIPQ